MRGRKPALDPTIPWKIRIPSSLAKEIEAELRDPIFDRVVYGARSKLVVQLLRAWLQERRAEA